MGRGLASSRLDDASWRAAADVFHAEGMGLCLKWSRQDDIDKFAQTVLDHAGATFYTSRRTGLVVLKPIRDDYNVADLPHFTYDNGLLGVDEDESASQTGGVNEVIVKFRDPVTKQDRQVRAKNLGAIHAAGGVTNTSTKDFFGIPTVELAQRVAERERRAGSGFVRKFKLRFDRRGADIMPGSVFAISDAKRGIARMVLRAGRCEYGTLTDGTVTITALQDIFGLPATAYVQPEPPGYTAPSAEPVATTLRRVFEAPYRELVQQLGPTEAQAQDPTAGMLMVAAVAPTAMAMAYEVATRVSPAEFSTTAIDGAYCPSALLATGMTPVTTAVQLVGGNGLGEVRVGTAALLGEEIVRVDAINPLTGLCTFGRGCVDTVPTAHAEGTRIWFYDDFSAAAEVEYTQGVQVQTKVLTRTGSGILDMAIAPFDTTAVQGRAAKPYPPANVMLNGERYPQLVEDDLMVTWSHRHRLLQSDNLLDTLQPSVGPENETTYALDLYDAESNTLLHSVTGISGVTTTVLANAIAAPFVRVELYAVRNGQQSWQRFSHLFATAAKPEIDPHWGNVVLLMRFDGNLVDVKGGTFSAVGGIGFGLGRFGKAMLLATSGTSGALESVARAQIDLPADFTIEGWVRPTAPGAFLSRFRVNDGSGWQLYLNDTGKFSFYQYSGGGSYPIPASGPNVIDGAYHHIAVTRQGGTLRMFVDGVLVGSGSSPANYTSATSPLSIGYQEGGSARYPMQGEIDEIRITKGLARYTANFTPPATRFPQGS